MVTARAAPSRRDGDCAGADGPKEKTGRGHRIKKNTDGGFGGGVVSGFAFSISVC